MSQQKAFEGDACDDPAKARLDDGGLLRSGLSTRTAGWSASDAQRDCLEREVLRRRVLANLGVEPGGRISRRLDRQIDQATDLVLQEAAPDFLYRAYPMTVTDGTIHVGENITFNSRALVTGIGWGRQAVAYIATLGPAVDDAINQAMEDRPDFGLVVDTVASEAAEFLVDEVEQAVADRLPPWEAVSLPFSPGYCDWPVDEQGKLFSLLPDTPVGVTLLPTSLMTPRKSIAGLMGLGLADELNDTCNPCQSCRNRCEHRRHRGAHA